MERCEPIIQSLLDLDYYKLTMAQVAWKRFPGASVRYAFKNRTKKIPLAEYIAEGDLRKELEYIKQLKFSSEEIEYLRQQKIFSEGFLNFLRNLNLSPYTLLRDGNTYKIEAVGLWPEAILWETLILSVVNELYYRNLLIKKQKSLPDVWKRGQEQLFRKIQILALNPGVRFSDFGTRRRFSRHWQEQVVNTLAGELPNQLMGTSNVFLAKKLGLKPIGTFAHEMYMVFSGIYHSSDEDIRKSHNKVLQVWWEEYGEPLSIALADTYGSDFFFRDFSLEQAKMWKALRQDSGDPIEFGEKVIAFYKQNGINPKTKMIVFSDGLNLKMILKIMHYFRGKIQVAFGWGTNLTNDLDLEALSLVVKAVESCGHGTVKLSDNLAKAMGNLEDIERFKKIFDHTVTLNEECKY